MKGKITILYYFTFLQCHLKFQYTLKSYLELLKQKRKEHLKHTLSHSLKS